MIVLGIDVGVNGAVACIDTNGVSIRVSDIPTVTVIKSDKRRKELDAYEFARMVDAMGGGERITHAFIEKVGAMPTDGPVQAFAFGQVFGGIRGVLAAHFIPMTLVSPAEWRKAIGVRKAEKKGDKRPSVDRANEVFPGCESEWRAKCHADRAEAALIAEYGRRVLSGQRSAA